ncbi:type II secretion system protein GspD [Zoogloea ramigera]|uniref:Type II secretion system protein GspD n=1 Tax=Zoogloea ramigera TaxID=350 RepID=A0A4Y4CRF3_ZOORA|nr:type II secretion system secretin GspD [Zoogloea ramigera]GEC94419.1 type II secretion system protein GspD [Zoogloea ramigera]
MTPTRRRPGFARRALAASVALTLSTSLLPSLPAQAAETGSSASGENISLNFVNAEIGAVIQAISKISGRNFIIDPRVKGTLNIVTARPVARHLTYSILLSALRLQGYAAVEGDGVTKIVPEADAKLHAVPVGKGKGAGGGDRLTTQVFNLKHESASQLVPVIRPLVSPNNTVTAYPGNNSLVVTDYAENIGRIAQIVESIDVPQGDMRVIPLQHASALDLAQTVTRLLSDGGMGAAVVAGGAVGGDASQRISVIGDPRTNSLLVRSENPSKLNAVRQLVANLDKPGAAGNIHVVYLKNAEAVKVAQTLRAVISGEAGNLGQSPGQGSTSGSSFAPTQTGTNTGSSTTGGMGNTPSFSNTSGNTSATGNGIVQADPMTNSLIITAPEAIYNNLRKVIDQLDKRRAQVYVEALITEVSTEKAAEIGIQWQAGKVGSTTAYGGTSFGSSGNNILNLAAGLASSSSTVLPGNGLNLVLGSGTVSVGGREIANLNMLARFLESDTKANILSTPNLVTLDNEEAKIVVGRNVPFPTGSYANTGTTTTVNPFTTIERKDVGLTLKVKPQISEGGTVRLQIYQEASAVIEGTATATTGPSTTKRSIESTVLVDDGAVIALGGLVEDTYSGGQEKVPVLGDIPYLGQFFRYDSRKRGKTNLIVFLRPVILRDASSIAGLSADRYNYIIGQQRDLDSPDRLMRREPGAPLLPPPGSPPPAVPYNVPTTAPLLPPAAAVAP